MIINSSYEREGYAASGEGILLKSQILEKLDENERSKKDICFQLKEGITEVEEGVFPLLSGLREIEMDKSVKKISVSEEDVSFLKRNGVVIRSVFDSCGEKFAREHQLRFIHADILLARDGNYSEPGGIDVLTLLFRRSGTVEIEQSNYCQGSSAGNNGGGDIYLALKKDFYRTMTQEDIAGMVWGNCCEKVRKNADLARFLKKAQKKGGWYLDFDPKNMNKKRK